MSSWKTYRLGIDFLLSNKKLVYVLLLINVLSAVFIAMPINNYIDLSIGDSLSMKVFNNGFDYMLISDFLDNYGMGIDAIMAQSTWSLLLLFLISIFVSGSILWSITQNRFSKNDFFIGGANYFWKLFRLSAFFIFIYLIVLVIVFAIFSNINGGLSPFSIESDATLVNSFWLSMIGLATLVALISTLHNIAKIDIIFSDSKWIFQNFTKAVKILRNHFLGFMGIFIINLGLILLTTFVYFVLRKVIPCEGGLGLVALMLVAQLFMLSKIGLNIVNMSSFYFMYKNKLDVIDTQL